MISRSILREFVDQIISEIDITSIQNMRCARGSTHDLQTCTIDGRTFYLKFSATWAFEAHDPSLQILVEYLAYRLYGLYVDVSIPDEIHIVYDRAKKKIGIATSKVDHSGYATWEEAGSLLSAGVFIDVMLANWDVVEPGNYIISSDRKKITRIDPGGSMTFRAQGGRKGPAFDQRATELSTMLDPEQGHAGARTLKFSDLKKAARTFMNVPWSSIAREISDTNKIIIDELRSDFPELAPQWSSDVEEISQTLRKRHATIVNHIEFMELLK